MKSSLHENLIYLTNIKWAALLLAKKQFKKFMFETLHILLIKYYHIFYFYILCLENVREKNKFGVKSWNENQLHFYEILVSKPTIFFEILVSKFLNFDLSFQLRQNQLFTWLCIQNCVRLFTWK